MFESINVYGEKLTSCCSSPKTGFFRDSLCNTSYEDKGMHTVCIFVSHKFLEYSRLQGNDLSTPHEQFGFPGLKEGDKWCLCAGRWLEAYKDGVAPQIDLSATHNETLAIIPLNILEQFSL